MLDQLYETLKELKQQYEASREVCQPWYSIASALPTKNAQVHPSGSSRAYVSEQMHCQICTVRYGFPSVPHLRIL